MIKKMPKVCICVYVCLCISVNTKDINVCECVCVCSNNKWVSEWICWKKERSCKVKKNDKGNNNSDI